VERKDSIEGPNPLSEVIDGGIKQQIQRRRRVANQPSKFAGSVISASTVDMDGHPFYRDLLGFRVSDIDHSSRAKVRI
jgi:hypothetical protein